MDQTHKNTLLALGDAVSKAVRLVDSEFPIHEHIEKLTLVCDGPGSFSLKFLTKQAFAPFADDLRSSLDERINSRPDSTGLIDSNLPTDNVS